MHVLLIHYWVKCGEDVLINYRWNSNLATFCSIHDCSIMKLSTLNALTLVELCKTVHIVWKHTHSRAGHNIHQTVAMNVLHFQRTANNNDIPLYIRLLSTVIFSNYNVLWNYSWSIHTFAFMHRNDHVLDLPTAAYKHVLYMWLIQTCLTHVTCLSQISNPAWLSNAVSKKFNSNLKISKMWQLINIIVITHDY